MIDQVDFDDSPITPGRRRTLRAWSKTPLTVEIKCFVTQPPPAGYKPCASCGVMHPNSGQAVEIVADRAVFRRPGGHLSIVVSDADGDRKEYSLPVATETAIEA